MIQIVLNGEAHAVATGATLPDLLRELGLTAGVLVEYNGRALFPAEWGDIVLAESDRLEILRVAAGG